ncbi:hypothetical protein [Endozoicomonas sp. 4G]|uniref:hypothetical protein n=1 Tax=Endozoicomonas sp. 4G TaxID=2872754 RepID=UPI002078A9DB|nr:hypothetical protein [Endozoicomonas sp. 4G]
MSAAPSVPTSSDKTPVEYFVDSEIVLKDGQDLIGAADDGFEIVIRDRADFKHKHILRIGSTENFKTSEKKDSHIKHITFSPTRNNKRVPIDSIVFAGCNNRKLIVEENVFHLPVKAAVSINCEEFSDASDPTRPKGPGLLFANNRIIGKQYNSINDKLFPYIIPDHGIFINLPSIVNQSKRLSVAGNTFEGNIAEAAEFRLGAGIRMEVFKNIIDISNTGNTTRDSVRKGGFVLAGPTDSIVTRPVFFLAGNQIKVTRTAITVRGQIGLTLACNHLQAFNPWWQPQKQFSLKAVPVRQQAMTTINALKLCQEPFSSSVVTSTPGSTLVSPTPASTLVAQTPNSTLDTPTWTPSASSLTANTWTPVKHSTATACTGLVNLEGQLFFTTEVCQPVSLSDADNSTTALPTSSVDRVSVTTALGVITTLMIWLTL